MVTETAIRMVLVAGLGKLIQMGMITAMVVGPLRPTTPPRMSFKGLRMVMQQVTLLAMGMTVIIHAVYCGDMISMTAIECPHTSMIRITKKL